MIRHEIDNIFFAWTRDIKHVGQNYEVNDTDIANLKENILHLIIKDKTIIHSITLEPRIEELLYLALNYNNLIPPYAKYNPTTRTNTPDSNKP